MPQTPERFPGEDTDELLEVDPDETHTTYVVTTTGGKVTQESWTDTTSGLELKRINYTFTGPLVTTEVRRVYDPLDGTTVVAQKTITYAYSGRRITGSTTVRDI